MKLLKYSLITFVWVAITGFLSTSAKPRFDELLDNKLNELIYYSNDIMKTVVEYKGDDIVELGKVIVNMKHKSLLDRLEKDQYKIAKISRCLWYKKYELYRAAFFEGILEVMDRDYQKFEIFFQNTQHENLNVEKFIEFTDDQLFSYNKTDVLSPYVQIMRPWRKYIPGYFRHLMMTYKPNPQCYIGSVEKLFAHMAALLGSVFTRQYTMILVSMKARQMPQLRTIPYGYDLVEILHLDNPKGYRKQIKKLHQKYIEKIEFIRKELFKAFDSSIN